jgi:hypothetical protein
MPARSSQCIRIADHSTIVENYQSKSYLTVPAWRLFRKSYSIYCVQVTSVSAFVFWAGRCCRLQSRCSQPDTRVPEPLSGDVRIRPEQCFDVAYFLFINIRLQAVRNELHGPAHPISMKSDIIHKHSHHNAGAPTTLPGSLFFPSSRQVRHHGVHNLTPTCPDFSSYTACCSPTSLLAYPRSLP